MAPGLALTPEGIATRNIAIEQLKIMAPMALFAWDASSWRRRSSSCMGRSGSAKKGCSQLYPESTPHQDQKPGFSEK
jgi:hypothetical protein